MTDWRRRLGRLPRWVFWLAGGAIACGGALAARLYADRLPLEDRVPIWLIGGGLIFLGVAVLSLGARMHREADAKEGHRS